MRHPKDIILRNGKNLQAYLEEAQKTGKSLNLNEADLTGANLKEANLERTNLKGVDLREVKGLTQKQLERARGDSDTLLPAHLTMPKHWEQKLASLRLAPVRSAYLRQEGDAPIISPTQHYQAFQHRYSKATQQQLRENPQDISAHDKEFLDSLKQFLHWHQTIKPNDQHQLDKWQKTDDFCIKSNII